MINTPTTRPNWTSWNGIRFANPDDKRGRRTCRWGYLSVEKFSPSNVETPEMKRFSVSHFSSVGLDLSSRSREETRREEKRRESLYYYYSFYTIKWWDYHCRRWFWLWLMRDPVGDFSFCSSHVDNRWFLLPTVNSMPVVSYIEKIGQTMAKWL